MTRVANLRLLWGAVRRLREGEAALRDRVAATNDRDCTNADVAGTEEYTSLRRLSDGQLAELAKYFRREAGLPAPSRRPAGPRGGRPRRPELGAGEVTYLASEGERTYALELLRVLGWTEDARQRFISRQTRGRGLATHDACTAVIAPLERLARAQGYQIIEQGRIKRIVAPSAPGAGGGA